MDIEVVDYSANRLTGYMEVTVRAVAVDGNQTTYGPIKTYGIEPTGVAISHNGDIRQWLDWVKNEHSKFTGINQDMVKQVAAMKGRKL